MPNALQEKIKNEGVRMNLDKYFGKGEGGAPKPPPRAIVTTTGVCGGHSHFTDRPIGRKL